MTTFTKLQHDIMYYFVSQSICISDDSFIEEMIDFYQNRIRNIGEPKFTDEDFSTLIETLRKLSVEEVENTYCELEEESDNDKVFAEKELLAEKEFLALIDRN